MRLGMHCLWITIFVPPAVAGPTLVEDVRFISAFAHAIDDGGSGVIDGPNISSTPSLGAHFGGLEAANSAGGDFDAIAAAGTKQFSFFDEGGFTRFSADAIAEVVADRRNNSEQSNARAEAYIRLVFELDQDMFFTLEGEFRTFELGGGDTNVHISLSASGAQNALFERNDVGIFASSGYLEKGTWVFELLAEATASSSPSDADLLDAQAIFRDVRFTLVPAPTTSVPLALAGLVLARRRRR